MNETKNKMHVPHWHIVQFPGGRAYKYRNLERANIGRIWARAWFNFQGISEGLGYKRGGWTDLATHLGYRKKPPFRTTGIDGPATQLYESVINGRLPKDDKVTERLFQLAGYPWK